MHNTDLMFWEFIGFGVFSFLFQLCWSKFKTPVGDVFLRTVLATAMIILIRWYMGAYK